MADLYNQQLALASTAFKETRNGEHFAIWQAAFVEDAVCMHLAIKRGFSNAIYSMLHEAQVREILENDGPLGKAGVQDLETRLAKFLKPKT